MENIWPNQGLSDQAIGISGSDPPIIRTRRRRIPVRAKKNSMKRKRLSNQPVSDPSAKAKSKPNPCRIAERQRSTTTLSCTEHCPSERKTMTGVLQIVWYASLDGSGSTRRIQYKPFRAPVRCHGGLAGLEGYHKVCTASRLLVQNNV